MSDETAEEIEAIEFDTGTRVAIEERSEETGRYAYVVDQPEAGESRLRFDDVGIKDGDRALLIKHAPVTGDLDPVASVPIDGLGPVATWLRALAADHGGEA